MRERSLPVRLAFASLILCWYLMSAASAAECENWATTSCATRPPGAGMPAKPGLAPRADDPVRQAIRSAAHPPPPKRREERATVQNKGRPFQQLRWGPFAWPAFPSREWEATR